MRDERNETTMTTQPTFVRASRFALIAAVPLLLALPARAATPVSIEFDAFGMFWNAEPMVKSVMVLLVLASVVSWALFVAKLIEIRNRERSARAVVKMLSNCARFGDLGKVTEAGVSAMQSAVVREIDRSGVLIQGGLAEGAKERVQEALARIEQRSCVEARHGLPVLASVGSVGPFVGLFGTVWGIMHSFSGIAGAGATSLAVVAPGISEALLATALGLIAAIPATIMYNLLGRRVAGYRLTMGDCAYEMGCLAAREIDAMVVLEPQEGKPDSRVIAILGQRGA
jgi:biopolymer transport protein ExbB